MTQEAAAEKLGISDSSIRAYETGQRIPPPEVVGPGWSLPTTASLLGIQHLQASADMARSIVPDIREVRLPEAIMELLDRVYGFVDAHQGLELLRIGKDGIIDDQSAPIFDAISGGAGRLGGGRHGRALRQTRGILEEGSKVKKATKRPLTDEEIMAYDNVPIGCGGPIHRLVVPTIYRALREERAPFGFAVCSEETGTWTTQHQPRPPGEIQEGRPTHLPAPGAGGGHGAPRPGGAGSAAGRRVGAHGEGAERMSMIRLELSNRGL